MSVPTITSRPAEVQLTKVSAPKPPPSGVQPFIEPDGSAPKRTVFDPNANHTSGIINNGYAGVKYNQKEVETPETVVPAETATPTEPTEKQQLSQARQKLIAAQKAERIANDQAKKSREMFEKATKYEEALAKAKEDPYAIPTALGLNPDAYVDSLVKKMADDLVKTTPEQKRIAELEAKLAKQAEEYGGYIAEQKQQQLTAQEIKAETELFQSQILPLITENKDKYESLILSKGDETKAGIYVWETMKAIWNENVDPNDPTKCNHPLFTDVAPADRFRVAMEGLNDIEEKALEAAIILTSKSKKFSKYYAQQVEPSSNEQKIQGTRANEYIEPTPEKSVVSVPQQKPQLPPASGNPVNNDRPPQSVVSNPQQYMQWVMDHTPGWK